MITVQRNRLMNVPVENVRALISDPEQLQRAIGVGSVEVLSRNGDHARVAVNTGLSLPGAERVEGDAVTTPEGMRFTANQPMSMLLALTAVPQGTGSDVTVRIETELPPGLGMMARFIPQQLIEQRAGAELDRALERLEHVAQSQ